MSGSRSINGSQAWAWWCWVRACGGQDGPAVRWFVWSVHGDWWTRPM